MSKLFEQMRLDRLLANMGYGSRRDIQQWVKAKAIVLDGNPVADADGRIAVTPDLSARMTILGKPLDPPPGMILMLHKPLGVTCSHKEVGPIVYDLLPARWRNRKPAISTVGRLDKESSGLLLMTDDGGLLHRLISPKSHSPKRYVAKLARVLKGDEASIFASGTTMLEGEDKPLLAAVLEVLSPTEARLTLTEGRYHQVRRMFAAVGNHVEALHRDRIGSLDLPADLTAGSYRLLTVAEIEMLGIQR
ncbi:MAG: pseudouridine synthase [Hyphomicrobiaceae bacterium]